MSRGIFFAWFYRYLSEVRGLNLKASAFYGTLPFLAMAIACPLGGWISDTLTRVAGHRIGRCGVAGVAIALAGIFLAFGASVDSARLASVILAGGAGALYLAQSSYWSVSADVGGSYSGSVSGFMNMGAQSGGALTAYVHCLEFCGSFRMDNVFIFCWSRPAYAELARLLGSW